MGGSMNSIGSPDPNLNLAVQRAQTQGALNETAKHVAENHEKEVDQQAGADHSGADKIVFSPRASELTAQEEEQQAGQAPGQSDLNNAQLQELQDKQQQEHKTHGHGGHHAQQTGRNFAQQGQSSLSTPKPKMHLSQAQIDEQLRKLKEQSGEEAHEAEDAGIAPESDTKKAEKEADKKAHDQEPGEESEALADQAAGSTPLNGQQTTTDLSKLPKTDEQRIEELRSGVPRENWEAARVMVGNQIEANKPSQSLTDIKSPEGLAPISVEPESYHPPLELCERNIGPLEPQLEEHEMATA
ncbi:MAG: hypothetical protein ACYCW6_31455 [Candidatus Xenobia bacterium]